MASTVLPNGIIIPEKYSRDWYADLYHNWQELDNLLGGGTPKDGTLTIQKNGTTVGTFSANQATDETVNIEVPTKTSDLNNDSGFITGVSWNDVADKPSFATVATSGSYNDLSNKPTIPTVNDATLTIQQNGTTVDSFSANSSTDKTVNITVPTKTSDLTNDSGFITSDNTKIPLAGSNQISGSLIPATTNAYDLGTSTNKWKSLNGIAPDELGLPTSTYTDVSSYITNFDSTPNTFTAPVSGFLNIVTDYTGDIACSVFNMTTGIQMGGNDTLGQTRILLPLEQGNTITLYISKSGLSIARIYHLKGKV